MKRHCPNGYIWLFYTFCKEYARQPADLEDMLDGLRCIRAQKEVEEIYRESE